MMVDGVVALLRYIRTRFLGFIATTEEILTGLDFCLWVHTLESIYVIYLQLIKGGFGTTGLKVE
jgi:hypothetical protein